MKHSPIFVSVGQLLLVEVCILGARVFDEQSSMSTETQIEKTQATHIETAAATKVEDTVFPNRLCCFHLDMGKSDGYRFYIMIGEAPGGFGYTQGWSTKYSSKDLKDIVSSERVSVYEKTSSIEFDIGSFNPSFEEAVTDAYINNFVHVPDVPSDVVSDLKDAGIDIVRFAESRKLQDGEITSVWGPMGTHVGATGHLGTFGIPENYIVKRREVFEAFCTTHKGEYPVNGIDLVTKIALLWAPAFKAFGQSGAWVLQESIEDGDLRFYTFIFEASTLTNGMLKLVFLQARTVRPAVYLVTGSEGSPAFTFQKFSFTEESYQTALKADLFMDARHRGAEMANFILSKDSSTSPIVSAAAA